MRLLCVFLTSLLRRSAEELADLGPELQAFCVQFSRMRCGSPDPCSLSPHFTECKPSAVPFGASCIYHG